MRSRNPYAAQQFLTELQEKHKNAKMEPVGDPDGFGVQRSFKFDKTSSKTLAKILPELSDERIESFEEKSGAVQVTFTHRPIADRRGRFALSEARTVVESSE